MLAGFIAVDAEWRIARVNPRAESLLRRSAAELAGQLLWDAVPDLRGSAAERELRRVPGGRVERRVRHFSPTLYNWFELWAVPADDDVYVFFQDVSDRARLMQSDAVRDTVRQFLEDAPIAVSITRGPEHRFEFLNAAARALVGGRHLEGRTARAALSEADPALFAILDQVYASGEPVTLREREVTFDRTGDGQSQTSTFDVRYQPVREADGSISGLLSLSVETAASRRFPERAPSGAHPPARG